VAKRTHLRCSRCGETKDFFVRIRSLATLVFDAPTADGLGIDISEKTPADYEWVALHCGRSAMRTAARISRAGRTEQQPSRPFPLPARPGTRSMQAALEASCGRLMPWAAVSACAQPGHPAGRWDDSLGSRRGCAGRVTGLGPTLADA